jgi:hypothetical protein
LRSSQFFHICPLTFFPYCNFYKYFPIYPLPNLQTFCKIILCLAHYYIKTGAI